MLTFIQPGRDYTAATKPGDTLWIAVAGTSVHLKHGDEGVSVTLYAAGREDGESIGETWASHAECGHTLPAEPAGHLPRLKATFQPEAWIGKIATPIDGAVDFDCTVSALRLYDAAALNRLDGGAGDNDDLADHLPERHAHSGPFEVTCAMGAVSAFFAANGFDNITDATLAAMRERYGVEAEG